MPSFHDQHRHHQHHPPPKPNQKFLSLILKTVIMTFITTLFFLFLGVAAILLLLATAVVHRHSSPANSDTGCFLKDLKKLPQFRFPTRTSDIECVVCLEGIRQGQWCRKLLGCGHVFHRKCVDTWLVRVPACPVCRTRVRLDVGNQPEDRSFWSSRWRNELSVWNLYLILARIERKHSIGCLKQSHAMRYELMNP